MSLPSTSRRGNFSLVADWPAAGWRDQESAAFGLEHAA